MSELREIQDNGVIPLQREDARRIEVSNEVTETNDESVVNDQQEREKTEPSKSIPLSLLVQGPDGLLFLGTETLKDKKPEGGNENSLELDANGEPVTFNFEEASRPDPTGLEALHIIFPELPNRPETTTLDLSGLEPIMSNTHVQLFKRRVRCFLFLLVLGMCFYFSVFIVGLVQYHRNMSKPAIQRDKNPDSVAEGLDYLTNAIITTNNVFVAITYLILYISLDFVGIFGTTQENIKLLTTYLLVESSLTFVSAIHAIRPFLIYRIVIVLLALQIRHGIIAKRRAIQRLYFRITGENLPMDRHQYFRIWRARIFNFGGRSSRNVQTPRRNQSGRESQRSDVEAPRVEVID